MSPRVYTQDITLGLKNKLRPIFFYEFSYLYINDDKNTETRQITLKILDLEIDLFFF